MRPEKRVHYNPDEQVENTKETYPKKRKILRRWKKRQFTANSSIIRKKYSLDQDLKAKHH